MLQHLPENWQKVTLSYVSEKWIGQYVLNCLNESGIEEMICPSKYSITMEEKSVLSDFIAEANKSEKCNKLIVSILPNNSFTIEYAWDEAIHTQSEMMEEHHNRVAKERESLSKLNITEDLTRFEPSVNRLGNEKIFDLEISNSNIISDALTRSFSLFNQLPTVINEGFVQPVIDKVNNIEFSIELNQFGLGYYAENNNENVQESIQKFHNTLFSPNLVLKECALTFESDFGSVTIGYDGKNLIYEEVTDDNKV
ncbi:hypothetical protein CRYO30217_01655 [Parvicella tangerina]|uniref:Uncharacterized protein n=2 Tax=Parvicella tangerina TaxID=2829795 RepID=A0A916NAV5_9FLAO|nr:hypothetical protein CRYO30217_01655 [Parvicella tangerina]